MQIRHPRLDGPVLTQTDLYLLGTELELNPILANTSESFQLIFNLSTGVLPPFLRRVAFFERFVGIYRPNRRVQP